MSAARERVRQLEYVAKRLLSLIEILRDAGETDAAGDLTTLAYELTGRADKLLADIENPHGGIP